MTTLLFGLIVLWGVRETRPAELEGRPSLPVGERVRALWAEPILLAFTGLALVFGTVYAQSHITLPVDMAAHGMTPEQYGLVIAINGALIVILGIPASNAARRWPRFGALAVAGLLLGIGFGLPAVVASLGGYAISVSIWTLGRSAPPPWPLPSWPTWRRSTSEVCIRACWGGLGLAFSPPVLGGWIYEARGRRRCGLLPAGRHPALLRLPDPGAGRPAANGGRSEARRKSRREEGRSGGRRLGFDGRLGDQALPGAVVQDEDPATEIAARMPHNTRPSWGCSYPG
jgi:hypothetical protein